jgi:predicted  nucleic acid-binding Zn-ribbon protein
LGTKKITEQTNAHKEVELNNRNKVIDTLKSRINYLHYEIGDQSDKIDDLEWRIDDLESNN